MRVIARLNVGGPAIHVTNLNAGLDPACFESVLVSGTENPGEGSMAYYAASRGVHPVIVPEIVGEATFKPRDFKALGTLVGLMRRERPQIVHTHTAKAGFVGRVAGRLAGVPIVIHTYHGHVLNGYYSPRKTQMLRRMEQGLALGTDHLVAVSEQVKRDLVSYGVAAGDKVSVIPLGFDLAPFAASARLRGQFRSEFGLGTRPLVGIVGRLFPIKNHHLFLEAAARIAQGEPEARFVIVGDGTLRGELEARARALGIAEHVVWTGWRQDTPAIYADLDVLVVSSDNEGTPVSAIEAMASGKPVVATRVGGLPDLIEDGVTGYLVPARDAAALANAVVGVLRNPRDAACMGERAQRVAVERFAEKRLVAETEALYRKLLAAKGLLPLGV